MELPTPALVLEVRETDWPGVPAGRPPEQEGPELPPPNEAPDHVAVLAPQLWLHVAPGLTLPQAPVGSQVNWAEPWLPLVEVTATVPPGVMAAAAPEHVRPPTVQDWAPAEQGAETQVAAPDLDHVPFAQVKELLPVRPLLAVTSDVTPFSAALTGPSQTTPGAVVQLSVPPLQGMGELVPPTEGTQLGIGVFTDHCMPAGQEKPGWMDGVVAAWPVSAAITGVEDRRASAPPRPKRSLKIRMNGSNQKQRKASVLLLKMKAGGGGSAVCRDA